MDKRICMIIPVYTTSLSDNENYSVSKSISHFEGYDIYFVCPKGLKTDYYKEKYARCKFVEFPKKYFLSERTYSKLLLTEDFYKVFSDYEYMLICQTDAILLKAVNTWIDILDKRLDYIGAPWKDGNTVYKRAFKGISLIKNLMKPVTCYVGNGGFSLRKIASMIYLTEKYHNIARQWNSGEDAFFAYYGLKDENFNIADLETAEKFAAEKNAKEVFSNGHEVIGVHAWEKYCPNIKAYIEE